jgi:hypothetical protein
MLTFGRGSARVQAARAAALDAATAERDQAIRAAIEARIPYAEIAKATGYRNSGSTRSGAAPGSSQPAPACACRSAPGHAGPNQQGRRDPGWNLSSGPPRNRQCTCTIRTASMSRPLRRPWLPSVSLASVRPRSQGDSPPRDCRRARYDPCGRWGEHRRHGAARASRPPYSRAAGSARSICERRLTRWYVRPDAEGITTREDS